MRNLQKQCWLWEQVQQEVPIGKRTLIKFSKLYFISGISDVLRLLEALDPFTKVNRSSGPFTEFAVRTYKVKPIHLQWVPSHVGLSGNEVADDLVKATTSNPVDPEDHVVLTLTEFYSRAKELICRTWVVPPVHPWYFQRHPGSAI
ncbi:RNase H domain-containing protein [Trichonephila clavipes]|nr:RNase H domain-containing protein [Trichonephila clavipes]